MAHPPFGCVALSPTIWKSQHWDAVSVRMAPCWLWCMTMWVELDVTTLCACVCVCVCMCVCVRACDKFKAEDSKSLKQWVTVCIECRSFVGQVDEGLSAVLPSRCCHFLTALYTLQVMHARNLKRTYPHICGNVWPVTVVTGYALHTSKILRSLILFVCACVCARIRVCSGSVVQMASLMYVHSSDVMLSRGHLW